ncbi:hypothetical protein DMH18_15925 [Streptomyces sp. WAC 06783]|nr:hypothetical protein DMH18_15925 [Streptomyces sp. WAC 06783]
MPGFVNARTGAPLRCRAAVVAGIAAGAVFVTAAAAHASGAPTRSEATSSAVAVAGSNNESLEGIGTDDQVLKGLEEVLTLINSVPDEVLAQGEEATAQWLTQSIPAKSVGDAQTRAFDLGGCARGIAVALGSNLFALGKVYKLKKAIDKLGGVKKIIAKIRSKKKMGKTFKKGIMEVFEEAGSGLGAIGAEILGVDGVIKHCW